MVAIPSRPDMDKRHRFPSIFPDSYRHDISIFMITNKMSPLSPRVLYVEVARLPEDFISLSIV